ncbi:hypothetical protein HJFPF1_01882 [Paramyrothecium foliicola]|nr:hypothetical protein HJFPF1_01882 [Paramyrothecium foliicola]
MDGMRGLNPSLSGSAGKQTATTESPEQLLDVFKAAALSVTKLYKTSALAEAKARTDGYQDCLDDLLAFLDKENLGLSDGEGWRIRRWATERLDGRETAYQGTESEEEVERNEPVTAPAPPADTVRTSTPVPQPPSQVRAESAPATLPIDEPPTPHFVVPSQENFTFQSSHQYPNIATLDLSDSRTHDNGSTPATRSSKGRLNGSGLRPGGRSSNHLGRGAGNKRKMDFNELFGGCLGGKDPFGNGGKRSRHA